MARLVRTSTIGEWSLMHLTAADVRVMDTALSYLESVDKKDGVLVSEENRNACDRLHSQVLAIRRGD